MAEKSKEKIEKATLLNYHHNLNNMTYGCIGFICGARFDKKGKEGTAHGLEHLLITGEFNVKTKDENGVEKVEVLDEEGLYKFCQRKGIKLNARTSNDAIYVEFEAPSEYLETVVDIIQQMYHRTFVEERWVKERKAILQELYMYLDKFGINSLQANRSAKTKDKILGTPKSLNSIHVQDFEDYAQKRFIRDNMVISVVSSLPHKQVKKIVKNLFIDKFPSNAKRKLTLKVPTYPHKGGLKTKDAPHANSFDIQFLFKGLDGVEKNDLMLRFENWYFNDFAGKLYQELRTNNQLVYTSNFLSVPVLNSNLKAFVVKTSPENAKKCVEVLCVILRDLIKNGVSEEDFASFKEAMLNERAAKKNTKFMDSNKMLEDYIYGKQVFVKDFFNKLMNLKREDVNDYLKKVYGNSELLVYYEGDMLKAQNIKLAEGKNGLIVVDKTYPWLVVTQEQLVKDYLNIKPLYNHDEILSLYRYWDEIRLKTLKMQIQAEYNSRLIGKLRNPQKFRVPKVGRKAVRQAYIKTLEEKNAQYKQEEENRKAAKEATSAEKEEAEKEWEYK